MLMPFIVLCQATPRLALPGMQQKWPPYKSRNGGIFQVFIVGQVHALSMPPRYGTWTDTMGIVVQVHHGHCGTVAVAHGLLMQHCMWC